MAASYPSSLPAKDSAGANLSTNPHSALHDDMYDEIVAIATELGTLPKGTATSVKARLDLFESGAWTSYTPTVSQGASTDIAKTVHYAKYARWGRLVMCNVSVSVTASGSAGSAVNVTLPVSAAYVSAGLSAGSVYLYDASITTKYICTAIPSSTTTVAFYASGVSAAGGWGADPNVALANTDFITFSLAYEAAT